MRKGLWILSLCFLALPIGAQNEKENGEKAKSVVMKEVTVEAARVTKKVDGLFDYTVCCNETGSVNRRV